MNRFRPSRRNFNCLAFVFMVVSTCCWGTAVQAQTVRIQLVNGRNGRPVADSCVDVWVGNTQKEAMAIPTDRHGVATLRLTENDTEISVHRWKGCGGFDVINPVVKYSESFRVHAGYVLCQFPKPDYSWLSIQTFSTRDVLRSGVVTANVCGHAKASPEPGELVVFVRPLTFWEKFKQ